MRSARFVFGLLIACMMVAPTVFVFSEPSRAGSLPRWITTFGDGSSTANLTFNAPGTDSSLFVTIPNGATVLSATINVSGDPLTPNGKDYPENVTLDVGEDGSLEWVFDGPDYGHLGQQYLISNTTNSTQFLKVPFHGNGSFDMIRIRLPKQATVTRATLDLEGSHGAGPSNISTITQMQAWAPNQWVTQGNSVMVNSLNGNTLYDLMQFDLTSIPSTAFVSNGTLFFGRKGTSPYHSWGYSFADPLGAYKNLESWSVPTTKTLKESPKAESTNMMTNAAVFYDWNISMMMSDWVDGTSPNYGVCIHRTQPAIQDKWDYSLTPFILAEYGSPGNVSLVLNDTTPLSIFSQAGTFGTLAAAPDFSAKLNSYLTAHAADPADYVDIFGNEFFDIPFAISSTDPGRINISNIDIAYQYTGVVNQNPTLGDLTSILNELVPDTIDGGSTDIKLAFFSNHTGKLRISGIKIQFLPPDHAATIDAQTPANYQISMNENSTMDFNITASDLYQYPICVTWFFNKKEVANSTWNWSYFADYESAGKYNITVTINNGMHDTSTSWNLTVRNVNRAPILNSTMPADNPTMKENSTLEFRVNATDPDRDALRYTWFVNDLDKPGVTANSFNFTTDFTSAGIYFVRCQVSDTGNLGFNKTWRLSVDNVNLPPKIDVFNPKTNNVKIKETEGMTYSIMASDFDKQPLTMKWYLNGTEVTTALQYIYKSDYNSAGNYTVKVVVTDGALNDSHVWNMTVENVNRNPVPAIDRPTAAQEFMDTEDINFSAKSTSDPDNDALRYRWTEAGKDISTSQEFDMRFPAGEHEVTMEVTDALGGVNTSSIRFVVRFIQLKVNMSIDKAKYTEGDPAEITASVSNIGDARASDVLVEFIVDNKTVETKNINWIDGGGADMAKFTWKSVKGAHMLTIRVGNETCNTTVNIDVRLIPGIAGGTSTTMAISLILVIVILCAAAGGYVYYRKKKKDKQNAVSLSELSTQPQVAPPVGVEPAVPLYQPPAGPQQVPTAPTTLVQQPPAPAYLPPPPPAAAPPPPMPPQQAPVAPPTGPAVTEQREAEELLAITDGQMAQYEAAGNVNEQARQSLRLAHHFYSKGAYVKAISYCEKAEGMMK